VHIDLFVLGYTQFAKTTEQCLRSLLPQAKETGASIYVLDNGSPDSSANLQKEFCDNHPEIHALYSTENLGYAGGMNLLAANGTGDWLFLIGSDTIFYPHALLRLKQALENVLANVGFIGPVTNSAGTAQCIQSLGSTYDEVLMKSEKFFSKATHLVIPLYRADFFCVAIRRSLWNQLGGLDLIYGLGYYEDFDFSMRAKQLGYEGQMVEDALVWHQGSATFKGSTEKSQLLKKNKSIFQSKFPQAQMRHVRLDVYFTIQYILALPKYSWGKLQLEAISKHLEIRLESLSQNMPKGLIKKIFWKMRFEILTKKYLLWQKLN